jgi:hypothetical protein
MNYLYEEYHKTVDGWISQGGWQIYVQFLES